MIVRKIYSLFLSKYQTNTKCAQRRNIQVSVIGAAGDIGSNLALLLKLNPKITKLQLYDDDERVRGMGMELSYVPGGPLVTTFAGDGQLAYAIRSSELIVMVSRTPRKLGITREQMLAANAPPVQRVCRTIADQNPDVFLAISTNPINSILPFASSLLRKYNCYNPFKIFGVTSIDTARCRAFTGNALKVNPNVLEIPVIGGHSDDTIIPLFSNLLPTNYCVDSCQADTLTRLVRKAGTEVVNNKRGTDSSTLGMAWSINEFVEGIVDAIFGAEPTVTCYTANPHFGTRYFSGPTKVGRCGIIQSCCEFPMNDFETYLLSSSIPIINRDVVQGENYVQVMEYAGKGI